MKSLHTLAIALIAVFALAACGNDSKPADGDHDDHDAHDHSTKHGGVLVETSGHDMHFEVKHDEAAGLMQVWVYDGAMKTLTSAAPVIQLAEENGGHKLVGKCPNGGKNAHEWHFSHKALEGHVHGRLRLEHGGKTYNVDLPEDEHAHDDHEGHEHDKDHDHDHDHDEKDKDHDHDHDDK